MGQWSDEDDEAWRSIVENYGERVTIDAEPDVSPDQLRRIEDARREREARAHRPSISDPDTHLFDESEDEPSADADPTGSGDRAEPTEAVLPPIADPPAPSRPGADTADRDDPAPAAGSDAANEAPHERPTERPGGSAADAAPAPWAAPAPPPEELAAEARAGEHPELADLEGRWAAGQDADAGADEGAGRTGSWFRRRRESRAEEARRRERAEAESEGWGSWADPLPSTADDVEPADRFVPPAPTPITRPEPDLALAWAGVLGAPALLLVVLLTGLGLPTLVGYLAIGWFVGGFIYLVARMPREPRDPWDDGSRL
ncbi:hypothetical protein [Nocardioides bruguierae]|uniref:Uncharacterized protein n=1 Tax=Nocardioides bruguierae TaxID=2945102 RepID=A0A9X2D972_9ACTN|nr:hypothetical protein [Nocardioides bruguierae]MCM0621656.1 hypothetical protein [Nocardioides bruguierae]